VTRGRTPRLARGERRKASGEVVTYCNVQISPVTKRRLEKLAIDLGATKSGVVLDALFQAHPHLRPDAKEENG
jgi:hypothetical protein